MQQHLINESICSTSLKLYFLHKENPSSEEVYFAEYNRALLYTFLYYCRESANTSNMNTFRFLFNFTTSVLSVHYYMNPYTNLDTLNIEGAKKYVSSNVVGKVIPKEQKEIIIPVFLNRNLKKVTKKSDVKMQNTLSNRIVRAILYKS